MTRRRPVVLLVMAILNFAHGAVCLLLCGCLPGAQQALALAVRTKNSSNEYPMADMDQQIPGYTAIMLGVVLLIIFLSLVEIISGIGLLKVQRWGQWGSIFYGLAMVFLQVGYLVFVFGFVIPALEQVMLQMMPGMSAQSQFDRRMIVSVRIMAAIWPVLQACLLGIYALVLLVIMLLPNVWTAFAQGEDVQAPGNRDW